MATSNGAADPFHAGLDPWARQPQEFDMATDNGQPDHPPQEHEIVAEYETRLPQSQMAQERPALQEARKRLDHGMEARNAAMAPAISAQEQERAPNLVTSGSHGSYRGQVDTASLPRPDPPSMSPARATLPQAPQPQTHNFHASCPAHQPVAGPALPPPAAPLFIPSMACHTSANVIPDECRAWCELKDGEPFCLLCWSFATEGHILSDKHKRKKQWLDLYPLEQQGIEVQRYVLSYNCGNMLAIAGAAPQLIAAPVGGPVPWRCEEERPWYEFRPEHGQHYCKLCGKYADDNHLASEQHRKRSGQPQWHLSSADTYGYLTRNPIQMSEARLPHGWMQGFDRSSGQNYYWHVDAEGNSSDATFDHPSDVLALQNAPWNGTPRQPADDNAAIQEGSELWEQGWRSKIQDDQGRNYYYQTCVDEESGNRIVKPNSTTWDRPKTVTARMAQASAPAAAHNVVHAQAPSPGVVPWQPPQGQMQLSADRSLGSTAEVASADVSSFSQEETSRWKSTSTAEGQQYYYNESTGERAWHLPDGAVLFDFQQVHGDAQHHAHRQQLLGPVEEF